MFSAAAISRTLILEKSLGEEDESNVFELSFHNSGLRSMLGLRGCVRLRMLDLSFNRIGSIEGLDSLVELRELRLYGNELQRVGGLSNQRQLKVLLLHNNRLAPPVLDRLPAGAIHPQGWLKAQAELQGNRVGC